MQAGSYSWRGGEGSQTDLNGDDRKPPERVQDPRYPENPNATCCDEGEETAAIARSQPATGFVYMVNRFYEPETGRFTQADMLPYDLSKLTTAQNNRWTYCASDPINSTDPSGLFTLHFALAFGAGLYSGFLAGEMQALFGGSWAGFLLAVASLMGQLPGVCGGFGMISDFYAALLGIGALDNSSSASEFISIFGTFLASWLLFTQALNSVLSAQLGGLLVWVTQLGWVIGFILGYLSFAKNDETSLPEFPATYAIAECNKKRQAMPSYKQRLPFARELNKTAANPIIVKFVPAPYNVLSI